MNLYRCQEKAKEMGFNSTIFYVEFPAGKVKCRWFDAYMGLLGVDFEGLSDNVLTVRKLNKMFPNLICSNLTTIEV